MHPHHELLIRFYEALAHHDGEAMAACYHPDAMFMDPAFGRLNHAEVGTMWRMLMGRAKDMTVTYEVRHADEGSGSAHWEPIYTFSKTGRKVHNVIDSQFGFLDGLILAHRDQFNLWRWSRQALGPPGLLLGWSPLLQGKIQAEARGQLAKALDPAAQAKNRSRT